MTDKPQPEIEDSAHEKTTEKQLEFALFSIGNLEDITQRADSKAQFILGANAVLISVIVALFSDIRPIFVHGTLPIILIYGGLLVVFAVTVFISIVQAFLVVAPFAPYSQTKGSQLTFSSLLYFREIVYAHKNSGEYNRVLSNSSLQDMLINAGRSIYNLSVGANKKYDLLDSSIKWLIIGLVFWGLALISTLLL